MNSRGLKGNIHYSTTMQLCQLNQNNSLLTSFYVHKLKFISHKVHPSSSSHGQLREIVNLVNNFLNIILDYLQHQQSSNFKSSCLQMFFKIGVLFYHIPRKTPVPELLFNKVTGLEVCNFIKKRLQHRCLLVNIAKFLRTPILKNICEWLLLYF